MSNSLVIKLIMEAFKLSIREFQENTCPIFLLQRSSNQVFWNSSCSVIYL